MSDAREVDDEDEGPVVIQACGAEVLRGPETLGWCVLPSRHRDQCAATPIASNTTMTTGETDPFVVELVAAWRRLGYVRPDADDTMYELARVASDVAALPASVVLQRDDDECPMCDWWAEETDVCRDCGRNLATIATSEREDTATT